MVRASDSVPKDVVKVPPLMEPGAPEQAPPRLEQLWLDTMETVERPACGSTFTTSRVAWKAIEKSPAVVGFVADWAGDDGSRATAIVDARHAQTFGLGRVERCEHGLPIPAGTAGTLKVAPISASLGRGPSWQFQVAAEESVKVPQAIGRPDGAPALASNPFTDGSLQGRPEAGDEADKVALGAMLGVVGMAATLAGLLWPALRRRRKRIEKITCPACKAETELDLLDPATDGMFCPSCGQSSVYVSLEADGVPRATVLLLESRDLGDKGGEQADASGVSGPVG